MRLYSRDEIERLRFIKYLVEDEGVNLAGCSGCCRWPRSSADPAADSRRRPEPRRRAPAGCARSNSWARSRTGRHLTWTSMIITQRSGWRRRPRPRTSRPRSGGLARKHHPDVNPAATRPPETKFKEVNEAYEVLSETPTSGRSNDELGANWRAYEQSRSARGGTPGGSQYMCLGSGGFRPLSEDEVSDMFGADESPFSDFFRQFFGGAAERGRIAAGAARAAGTGTRRRASHRTGSGGRVARPAISGWPCAAVTGIGPPSRGADSGKGFRRLLRVAGEG